VYFFLLFGCSEKPDTATSEALEGMVPTDGGGYYVSYIPDPDPIPLNDYFNIQVEVTSIDDPNTLLTTPEVVVTAEMPEHNHGMPSEPSMFQEGDIWMAEGMLFQMTGYWNIMVYVTGDGGTEMAEFPVDCCE